VKPLPHWVSVALGVAMRWSEHRATLRRRHRAPRHTLGARCVSRAEGMEIVTP